MYSMEENYGINFYEESLENIERFLKTYPANKNIIYAEYLKAIIYFEQISDEKKDLKSISQVLCVRVISHAFCIA